MARRSPETLADYLVVAIAPALIMLLVGSLMWFLVEVFYQGEHKLRMLWIMTMFVIAIVGIARISIEEGMARASLFGWALAASVAFVMSKLVADGLFLGGLVMVLVWWAAHKLTWDCTVIDEDQDMTGQGLLQQLGSDLGRVAADVQKTAKKEEKSAAPQPEAVTDAASANSPPWWETLWEPDRRPHAPGVWVVYFSLAALPLFGIGGWFVPSGDGPRRALVFGLLVVYVACGMGLLLATSFLGLRRYLRQRKLEMPVEMTTTWILVGVVMIIAMLLVAAILPRPSPQHSLTQLPFAVTSAVRRASQFGVGKEGTKDDEAKNPATTEAKEDQQTERKGGGKQEGKSGGGRDGGQQGSSGKNGDGQSSANSAKSQSGGGEKKGNGGKPKGDKSDGGQSKERNAESQGKQSEADKSKSEDNGQQQPQDNQNQQQNQPSRQNTDDQEQRGNRSESPPQSGSKVSQVLSQVPSLLTQSFGFIVKWLFYGGLILGGLIAAFIYREELMAAWQKLIAELGDLWDWWFGNKKPAAQSSDPASEVVAPPRTFASYVDPFLSGDAHGMSWPQLVRYTFEALEAWGREQACPRGSGQTPHEFAVALAGTQPKIASGAQMLAVWYGQLAYAPKAAAPASIEPLRQLWAMLGERSPAPIQS